MFGQSPLAWLEEKKKKYLYGLDRQSTIVLLGSALFLILYLTYSRRSFFRNHFADNFGHHALWELYPFYYWYLTSAITLLLLPALAAKFGAKCRIRDLRLSFIPRKARLGVGCRCLCAHDPLHNTCFAAFSRLSIQISAVQNRWESMATFHPV